MILAILVVGVPRYAYAVELRSLWIGYARNGLGCNRVHDTDDPVPEYRCLMSTTGMCCSRGMLRVVVAPVHRQTGYTSRSFVSCPVRSASGSSSRLAARLRQTSSATRLSTRLSLCPQGGPSVESSWGISITRGHVQIRRVPGAPLYYRGQRELGLLKCGNRSELACAIKD